MGNRSPSSHFAVAGRLGRRGAGFGAIVGIAIAVSRAPTVAGWLLSLGVLGHCLTSHSKSLPSVAWTRRRRRAI